MTPEGQVKKKIKKRLEASEAWYFMPVQNGMGTVGIPDFICCVPVIITPDMVGLRVGLFKAIEAKAPGKRLATTPNQDRQLAGIHKAGGSAVVADDASQVEGLLT